MTAVDLGSRPRQLVTLAEWDAMRETEARVECIEGVLFVAASPRALHQRVAFRVESELVRQLPSHLAVLHQIDVLLVEVPLTVRCPDVVVTTEALVSANPPRLSAADVLLVVEVVSEGTARMDRVMKLHEYAEAGIPAYWIVDSDPLRLTAFELSDGTYRDLGTLTSSSELTVAGHAVTLQVDDLTAR